MSDVAAEAQWLSLPKSVSSTTGLGAQQLQTEISRRVANKVSGEEFTRDDLYYVSKVRLDLCKQTLSISKGKLEKLRLLCQLWDVDIRQREISSHRRFIGPVIVAAKRCLYPVLRVFLKDFIRQQKDFNAAVITLLTDLSNEDSQKESLGHSTADSIGSRSSSDTA